MICQEADDVCMLGHEECCFECNKQNCEFRCNLEECEYYKGDI